ncbi:MAG: DUF3110 domain-containing protein [Prochlorococcus sp.]|jgi:hypothetical protein|nr:DUF3110 domain-containing protein [Prochlorococcus sp.]CAI8177545.1 MAG: Uncharacterised protein [Prochlorococcus marinus str. MIT 9215]
MRVHVLLYDSGQDSEGIHSLELQGKTVVLLFENSDDAERYAGLLEAQDFPTPTVEVLDRLEIEDFCAQAGYEARFVEAGFMPKTNEDRLLLAPPEASRDVTHWQDEELDASDQDQGEGHVEQESDAAQVEAMRQRLEGLF